MSDKVCKTEESRCLREGGADVRDAFRHTEEELVLFLVYYGDYGTKK